jgi:hypothetical protein
MRTDQQGTPPKGRVHPMANLDQIVKNRGWLASFASILPAFAGGRRARLLDARRLSDHLKRDMGFLDGLPTDKRS